MLSSGVEFQMRISGLRSALLLISIFFLPMALTAVEKVEVVEKDGGLVLQVGGRDFMVNGMNWDYFPRGTTYSYSLWQQPDDIIKAALDGEMPLLKNMGVNAIRQYSGIQPKWVKYIYENYGIYTIINHSFGRYGMTIDGIYYGVTDYSDPKMQAQLISEVETMVEEFRGTPGLLMWLIGNENNYGLFWDGAETEDLPPGQESKQEKRAHHMYRLMNEVVKMIKEMDGNKPVAIANGDLLFLDIIVEEMPDLDIFGTNVYRGVSFGDLFSRVKNEAGWPVMFTEFGSDAFNAVTKKEDQLMQSRYLYQNWREIYENAAGMGGVGNAIGGCTFQFSDGWWKTGQEYDLNVQDVTASWSNGGYQEDFIQGENNMNEEWFGVCAKGPTDPRGLYELYPRAGYYLLQEIHRYDPYGRNADRVGMAQFFDSINIYDMILRARGDAAAFEAGELQKVRVSGVQIKMEAYSTGGKMLTTPEKSDGKQDAYPRFLGYDQLQAFGTKVEFRPRRNLSGFVSISYLGNVPVNPIDEIFYENRGRPLDLKEEGVTLYDHNRVQIYKADFNWDERWFNLQGFYRTGHFHWGYEGDFFGLYPEANYGLNIDIYNGMAPSGMEFTGKKALDGLKIAYGPELWWGANPAVLGKYQLNLGPFETTFMYQKDLDEQGEAVSSFAVPLPPTEKATVHTALEMGALGLELGGIWSGANKVGDTFQILDGEGDEAVVLQDEIRENDTYGGKIKLTFAKGRLNFYAQGAAMGLVADGRPNAAITYTGWRLKDSGSGNQVNFLSGLALTLGNWQIAPNYLWQKPIVGPIPADVAAPGRPRNWLDDPFAVRGNREQTAYELLINYDPTPASWLFVWDSDVREDAPLAFSLGYIYREFPTTQDAAIGIMADGRTIFAFPGAPPANDLWEVYARIISKWSRNTGFIANIYGGTGEANGSDDRVIERYGMELRLLMRQLKLSGIYRINDWGPYDYHRDFNLTYPLQVMGDLSYALASQGWLEDIDPRFGIRYTYRTLDEYSPRYAPENELDPEIGNEWEIRTYLNINIGI